MQTTTNGEAINNALRYSIDDKRKIVIAVREFLETGEPKPMKCALAIARSAGFRGGIEGLYSTMRKWPIELKEPIPLPRVKRGRPKAEPSARVIAAVPRSVVQQKILSAAEHDISSVFRNAVNAEVKRRLGSIASRMQELVDEIGKL